MIKQYTNSNERNTKSHLNVAKRNEESPRTWRNGFKILRRPPFGGTPQNDSVEVELSFWLAEGEEESLKNVKLFLDSSSSTFWRDYSE